jgi:hypothetical protein
MDVTVEILQVCSHAETLPDRTLNVFGITDTFRSPVFPCVISHLSILFRFRVPGVRKETAKLDFTIVDADGRTIMEQKGQIGAEAEDHVTSAVSNMVIRLEQFRFERAGMYEVRAYWNGIEVASTPLNLELQPSA